MKTIENRDAYMMRFEELKPGDVFIAGEKICMAIVAIKLISGTIRNAVTVTRGEMLYIDSENEVYYIPDAEIRL